MPPPPPGDLPDTGIEPRSPALQMDSLPSEPSATAREVPNLRDLDVINVCVVGGRKR